MITGLYARGGILDYRNDRLQNEAPHVVLFR
jgi:hypothetical protein